MSGENYFQDYVIAGLTRKFSACFVHKHRDVAEGVPDLSIHVKESGVNTWIELKAVADFPKRPTSRLKVDHYTESQALFLRQRKGWLFIRVRKIYYLFNGEQAWDFWKRGGFTKEEMGGNATAVWYSSVNFKELVEIIEGGRLL